MKKSKTIQKLREIPTLGLMDKYPFGDLKGSYVYQAIDHNPISVSLAHDMGKFRLDQKAIHRLVETIMPKPTLKIRLKP